MEPKFSNPTVFSKSPYTAVNLKDALINAVNKGGFENGGILAFVVSEDTSEVRLRAVLREDKDLPDVPVTDILSGYKEYLSRCVKKTSIINVPASPNDMFKNLWEAFAATLVASWNSEVNVPDLQILADILVKSYGTPRPILICKINFSVKNDTLKVWDVARTSLLDLLPTLEEDADLNESSLSPENIQS